jgi:phosphate/sulfate permease
MGLLYTVAVIILVLIIVFLIFRLLRQKVPKPRKSVESYDQNRNKRERKIPLIISIIFTAIGVAFIVGAIIWSNMEPQSMGPMLPIMIGGPAFLIGLIFFIGFVIQELITRKKESRKVKLP